MSGIFQVDTGQGLRDLTAEELAAYAAERAMRDVMAACGNGNAPDTQSEVYRRWKAADDTLHQVVRQGGYDAAVAWAELFFDRVQEVGTQTIAERRYDLQRAEAGR